MIKNIEDLKKCQIVCRNQRQVKDCFDDIKNMPYFFFNSLKNCNSDDLKNIINS